MAARAIERELTETRARLGARERDLDFLEFEIAEIEEVGPGEDEEPALERERGRLGAVETLRHAASAASEAIDPSEMDSPGGMALLADAAAQLRGAGDSDEALGSLASRAEAVVYELEDIVAELRSYLASVEADPGRLAVVEERLEQLARLKRKHGGTIEAVLEHAERCRTERDRLANAGETTARLEGELEQPRRRPRRAGGTPARGPWQGRPRAREGGVRGAGGAGDGRGDVRGGDRGKAERRRGAAGPFRPGGWRLRRVPDRPESRGGPRSAARGCLGR